MQVQVEQLEPCKVALHVEVAPDHVKRIQEKAFKEVSPYVEVPGFRRGKAPKSLIQRYMNQDVLRKHTLTLLVPSALEDAVKEAGLEMFGEPEIVEEPMFAADEPVTFTATFSTPPNVELGAYTGLRIEYPAFEVGDADVDRAVHQIREQRTSMNPVHRPTETGDFVTLDYSLHVEGQEDESGPMLRVAGKSVDPIDQAVVGHSAGETLTVEAPIPSDPDAIGVYEISIKEVRNWSLPELDDSFAQTVGFDDLAAMRESLRGRLQIQAQAMVADDVEQRLINAVLKNATIIYPRVLLDQNVASRTESLMSHLDERHLTLDEYLAHEKKTVPELEEELEASARSIIESQLILSKVAQAESLRVTEAEIAEEIGAMDAEDLEGRDSTQISQQAANTIAFGKILEFLKENNELVPTGGSVEPAPESSLAGSKEGGWASRLFGRRGGAAVEPASTSEPSDALDTAEES